MTEPDGVPMADVAAGDWLDISVPVRAAMPLFPGDPPVRSELVTSIARGDVCNVTRLDMGAHTGTHIDAPVHFLDGGPGAESIPLDAVIGPAYVVDALSATGPIDSATLERMAIPDGETRVLFKTTNSELWNEPTFSHRSIALAEDAARVLAERGARLVGVDYLSVAPFGDPVPTHRALLEAGVVILEGIDLRAVQPGFHELLCLPLRLVGCDGAPCRALLRPRAAAARHVKDARRSV